MPVKCRVCFKEGEMMGQWVAWCRPVQMIDSLMSILVAFCCLQILSGRVVGILR